MNSAKKTISLRVNRAGAAEQEGGKRASRMRRALALAGALALASAAGASCAAPYETAPPLFGPLEGPEGATRGFYTRVLLHTGVGTGARLDESLFAFRLPGERLGPTRAALGAALVEYLEPLFDRSLLFVDPAVVRIGQELEPLSKPSEPPKIDAPLLPLLPDETEAVVRARLVSRADDARGHVLFATWRLRDHRWRLVSLSLDGDPVLPLTTEPTGAPPAR